MKIVILSGILTKHLSVVNSVIKDRPAIPITSSFLFETNEGTLTITGTNSTNDIKSFLKDVEVKSEGACLIPAKDFYNILKSIPNQLVEIIAEKKEVLLKTSNGDYKFPTEDNTSDFPKRPIDVITASLEIDVDILAKAIDHTFFIIPGADAMSNYEGLFIHNDSLNKLRFVSVAASGAALALFKSNIEVKDEIKMRVSRASVSLLKGIITNKSQSVKVEYNNSNATFICDNTRLTCSILGVNFVNYEQVIPTSFSTEAHLNKDRFLSSLKRVNLLTQSDTAALGLNFKEKARIVYSDSFAGKQANEVIEYDFCDNKDFSINVKAREFSNMISALEDNTVKLMFTTPERLFACESLNQIEGYIAQYFAMPMYVSKNGQI